MLASVIVADICNHSFCSMSEDRIVLIVCGVRYESQRRTLQHYPETLLSNLSQQVPLNNSEDHEIVLDCDTTGFEAILFHYQSEGILVRPTQLSIQQFEQLCRFFKLAEDDIRRMKRKEGIVDNADLAEKIIKNSWQRKLWKFLEEPKLSRCSRMYGIFGYFITLLSVFLTSFFSKNSSPGKSVSKNSNNKPTNGSFCYYDWELIISIGLSIEYLLRLVASPLKLRFVSSPMNVIDLLSFLPYLFAVIAPMNAANALANFTRTSRVLKLLQIDKVVDSFDSFYSIIIECIPDIIMLVISIIVSAVFCGSLQYLAEMHYEDSQLDSIPQSVWWAMQTIVPLGYGDVVPQTFPGKFIGGIVAISSAIIFTVPLLFVGGRFLKLCSVNQELPNQRDFNF